MRGRTSSSTNNFMGCPSSWCGLGRESGSDNVASCVGRCACGHQMRAFSRTSSSLSIYSCLALVFVILLGLATVVCVLPEPPRYRDIALSIVLRKLHQLGARTLHWRYIILGQIPIMPNAGIRQHALALLLITHCLHTKPVKRLVQHHTLLVDVTRHTTHATHQPSRQDDTGWVPPSGGRPQEPATSQSAAA